MAIIAAVILVVLITIAVPLRTYYEGRSEMARLNESIAAHEQQREELLREIDKYDNEEYVKQEARRRLGMVEEGETAYRIVDPRMDQERGVTTNPGEAPPQRIPWPQAVWDSIANPELNR